MGAVVSISSRIFAGLRALGVYNIVSVIWTRVVISCKIALRFHRKFLASMMVQCCSQSCSGPSLNDTVYLISFHQPTANCAVIQPLCRLCLMCVKIDDLIWNCAASFGLSAKSMAHNVRAWRDSWMKFRAFWLMKSYTKMKETLQTHNLINVG